MLLIPAGSFRMGSPEEEIGPDPDVGPVHEVTLGEFLMARTPITHSQWRTVASWEPGNGEKWARDLQPDPSYYQDENARLLEGKVDTDNRPLE